MGDITRSCSAILANGTRDGSVNWTLNDVSMRDIRSNEVLVQVTASGICSTDILFSKWPAELIPYPKILGHEGAGTVLKIGHAVTKAKVGDSVLMSFSFCENCRNCKAGHPSFCDSFTVLNYDGEDGTYTTKDRQAVRGRFFGQSTFARLSIVAETSIVNVTKLINSKEELQIFSPLGCGFQTGLGTVDRVAKADENDTIVIIGLGGVGLVSVMGAKLKGCKTIIGLDRVDERLNLSRELGATHTINTSSHDNTDIKEKISEMTSGSGSTITIDTTGNMELITTGLEFTAIRGQFIFVGVPPADAELNVHIITFMQAGKILKGSIEGDVTPSEYIPQMIQWYREGVLPIERLVRTYPANQYETALSDMMSGKTVKPVLTW